MQQSQSAVNTHSQRLSTADEDECCDVRSSLQPGAVYRFCAAFLPHPTPSSCVRIHVGLVLQETLKEIMSGRDWRRRVVMGPDGKWVPRHTSETKATKMIAGGMDVDDLDADGATPGDGGAGGGIGGGGGCSSSKASRDDDTTVTAALTEQGVEEEALGGVAADRDQETETETEEVVNDASTRRCRLRASRLGRDHSSGGGGGCHPVSGGGSSSASSRSESSGSEGSGEGDGGGGCGHDDDPGGSCLQEGGSGAASPQLRSGGSMEGLREERQDSGAAGEKERWVASEEDCISSDGERCF